MSRGSSLTTNRPSSATLTSVAISRSSWLRSFVPAASIILLTRCSLQVLERPRGETWYAPSLNRAEFAPITWHEAHCARPRVGGAATVYHFTSAAAAAEIAQSGAITAGSGVYGEGVYATAINSPLWATISGAVSAEVAIEDAEVLTTPWPGTFRIAGNVGAW